MSGRDTGRARWAAVGAALAVALGAGIIPVARAVVGTGDRNVFVPIAPCRLMDTRGGSNTVGPRNTPIGEGESYEVMARGITGNCDLPSDATAIATTTTVTNGTAASFLTVYPANGDRPHASNLNWRAGQPATPNQVTVGLSPDGRIRVYNDRGTVNVIMDVVGYYTHHHHDDRYYTKALHDALPSSHIFGYGAVQSNGTLGASHPNAPAVTTTLLDVGSFRLFFDNVLTSCTASSPVSFPTALVTPHGLGHAAWTTMVLGQCAGGRRDLQIFVSTHTATGTPSSLNWSYLLVWPGVGPPRPTLVVSPHESSTVSGTCHTLHADGDVEAHTCD